jgi:hypothetical protein
MGSSTRSEPQHGLLVLTLAKLDRLLHCLRAPLARDVPPARIHGHLDPEERACDLDVIDRKLDIAGRSSFDPDAEPWNSRLQLTQLLGRIGLRLLLSVANPEIIRRKLDSLPIQLGCHDQRTALD